MAGTAQLSGLCSALSDPTRRAIIAELAARDATVTELTAPLSISMPAVSRHLKVLERAALISRSRSGKWRASRLEAAPLREAADWIERYRRFLGPPPPPPPRPPSPLRAPRAATRPAAAHP